MGELGEHQAISSLGSRLPRSHIAVDSDCLRFDRLGRANASSEALTSTMQGLLVSTCSNNLYIAKCTFELYNESLHVESPLVL